MACYKEKLKNESSEKFRAESSMCVQDPFDLAHNLTKVCRAEVVDRFKNLCKESSKLLK